MKIKSLKKYLDQRLNQREIIEIEKAAIMEHEILVLLQKGHKVAGHSHRKTSTSLTPDPQFYALKKMPQEVTYPLC